MQPIDKAIQKLRLFFERNNIEHFPSKTSPFSAIVRFELPIESFTGPNRLGKNFSFLLHLWEEKTGQITYDIRTRVNSNVPYHPNFVINHEGVFYRNPYAVWIGYDRNEKSIEQHLKSMILSLQYVPGSIKIKATSVGNRKALNWYLKEGDTNKHLFPTSDFLTKNFHITSSTLPETKKKFEIKPTVKPLKKKFEIKQEKKFEPLSKGQPQYSVDSSLDSLCNYNSVNPAKLYITNQAKKHIFNHIHWGHHGIKETMSEQGGLLLGQVFYDPVLTGYYGIVEQSIPAESAEGTPVYLQMNHDTWNEMMCKIDKLQDEHKEHNLQVIGWYHTHPNELSVFMSGTDMNTQQKYFNQDWHFAIVLNPHRQIWKAFSGKDAKECRGYFLRSYHFLSDKDNSPSDKVIHTPLSSVPGAEAIRLEPMSIIVRLLRLRWFRIFAPLSMAALVVSLILFNRTNYKPPTRTKEISLTDTLRTTPRKEQGSRKFKMNQGSIIYNNNFKSIFKGPIANSIEVTISDFDDSAKKIETYLYVHRSASVVTRDSTLKIFEKLRTADSAFKRTLVGIVADTLFISKESYIIQGDWFKIKFSGVIKQ